MNSVVERLRDRATKRLADRNYIISPDLLIEAAALIASQAAEIERMTKDRDQMRRERDGANQSRVEATIEGARRVRALGVEKYQMEVRLRADLETAERLLAEATGVLEKIAKESRDEGGCYYTNRLNIDRARTVSSNIRGHNG